MDGSLATKIEAANSTVFTGRNADALGDFFAADYVAHLTEADGGLDAIRRFVGMLFSAFPDVSIEIEVLVEGEDRVAWQRTLRGIQEGEFMGFPASGREITWRDMVTSRFDEGLIVEEWVITDLAERLLRARTPGRR